MLASLLIGNGIFIIFIAFIIMIAIEEKDINKPISKKIATTFVLILVFISINCIAIGASIK
mgnify:CR=1 FL=1